MEINERNQLLFIPSPYVGVKNGNNHNIVLVEMQIKTIVTFNRNKNHTGKGLIGESDWEHIISIVLSCMFKLKIA
jgi:hypothetical protein